MQFKLCSVGMMVALLTSTPEAALAKGETRVEAQLGWDQIGQSANAPTNVLSDQKIHGVAYGGNIGYDVSVTPRVSFGIDAALSGTTAGQGRTSTERQFQIGRDIYAGARITLHAMPSLHLYAKVGYANARFSSNIGLHPGQGGKVTLDPDYARDNGGIRAGIGLQYSLIGPVYVLGEYRYTRYSEQVSRNQIVNGVGLRF
ncbi:outer membrane beta-barrel protein [Novosphingobium sp.]|uniref:outer membrane beta-barrel protein n=1 Tax=Novosphingobium sp. TaxID=1874826 RepID=UPI0031DDAF36